VGSWRMGNRWCWCFIASSLPSGRLLCELRRAECLAGKAD
jgi:hypothetical protein